MDSKRVPIYERLPEIYRIKDQEQEPPAQLQNYLALVEGIFSEIHKNIEALYHDLFIETCDDWVIPYIGDLLGVSYLYGDPWTLRADVADTIALRRRKGTLGAIERLTYDLTQWGVHCVELRENLLWNQHLNHQRPGKGGVLPLRDPALLSLLYTPFDTYAHVADLKPPPMSGYDSWGGKLDWISDLRYNIPNLAIFLWRLEAYHVAISWSVFRGIHQYPSAVDPEAEYIAYFEIHPAGEPLRLFNVNHYDPNRQPPRLTLIDETPNLIPRVRLTTDSPAGNPEAYVAVDSYDDTQPDQRATLDVGDLALQFHLPNSIFGIASWRFRGANLCAWEEGLFPPLRYREIAIDPVIGRFALGINEEERDALLGNERKIYTTYTYGAPGAVGAHPISRDSSPTEWNGAPVQRIEVQFSDGVDGVTVALQQALQATQPVIIEIPFSLTYKLDVSVFPEAIIEDGGANLPLNNALWMRATDGQRPVIELAQPLRFRPADVTQAGSLTVRLEGVYLTRQTAFPAGEPLIARAALNSLEILDSTLDPGGYLRLDGTRAPIWKALRLRVPYGFADPEEEDAFDQTPEIILQNVITGPLLLDTGFTLFLTNVILDAGSGVTADPATAAYALTGATGAPDEVWSAPTQVNGITVFGRTRAWSLSGRGGIWVHTLEVLDNQKGCIKFSYFSGNQYRLPPNHACVFGTKVKLRFNSEIFGQPAYAQLAKSSDFQIRERGPNDDEMGVYGFLMEAHKWRNLQIRFREFMPVGIRPLLVPVT